jgi:glucokinase
MILAGDVGGTKTILAFFEVQADRLVSVAETTYPSREHKSLDELVVGFLSGIKLQPTCACFGVAGPVRDGRAQTTNLPWEVETERLARELAIRDVAVINDLEATAYGISALDRADFAELHPGVPNGHGNQAVIAAGTGLGEAGLYWNGNHHLPFSCEGGHCDFSPHDDLELELAAHLIRRFGHSAWERVLSGPGLVNLFEFLATKNRNATEEEFVRDIRQSADPAAAISQAAIAQRSLLCSGALDLFVRLYGAEAGNLALKMMATGGVYIGGGIAPKILPKLQDGKFRDAFLAKGRLRPVLETIPIRVILNSKTALIGAARCAQLRSTKC